MLRGRVLLVIGAVLALANLVVPEASAQTGGPPPIGPEERPNRVDDDKDATTKGHYKFPYGDFNDVHRCAVLSAESRAGQYDHHDIELAAAHLHGMIDQAVAA